MYAISLDPWPVRLVLAAFLLAPAVLLAGHLVAAARRTRRPLLEVIFLPRFVIGVATLATGYAAAVYASGWVVEHWYFALESVSQDFAQRDLCTETLFPLRRDCVTIDGTIKNIVPWWVTPGTSALLTLAVGSLAGGLLTQLRNGTTLSTPSPSA